MAQAEFTRADLVAEAAAAGHEVSPRLVADWVRLGLLDMGTPRGRGRGKGKGYVWPSTQRNLFLDLLERREGVSRLALCNVPVIWWLIWGEAYVPLRQARRALEIWLGAFKRVPARAGGRVARRVLDQLDTRGAAKADVKELRDLIIDVAYGKSLSRAELLHVAKPVFDPAQDRRSGRPHAEDPARYLYFLEARLRAAGNIKGLPDSAYERARMAYLTTGPVAGRSRGSLAAGALTEPTHPGSLSTEQTNSACLDLLTLLGIVTGEGETYQPERPRLVGHGGRLRK